MTIEDQLTAKQLEALNLAASGKTRILYYGGSRSGKTFLTCVMIVFRAVKYPGSRHLIARLRYSHARGSIWLDTLREAVKFVGVQDIAHWHEGDHYVSFPNGSEIWIDGLDDKERVEKILGREYNTIFLNEVSQISYPTVSTVMTRLALKVEGCRNIAFFDCNPPSKFHWSYKMFIQLVDPEDGRPLDAKQYGSMRMNPVDNTENLPEGYIEDILEHLPEDQKRRFLRGEFGDAQGVIFKDWEIVDEIPEEIRRRSRHAYGLDFGFTVDPTALVDCYLYGNDLYLDEILYAEGLTNTNIAAMILEMGLSGEIYADSAEPKSIVELQRLHVRLRGAKKGPDSVRQGIDWLLGKKMFVTRRSANLQAELANYVWKQNKDGRPFPQPIDDFNHCFAGETMISTAYGKKRIDEIEIGDLVLTRKGFKPVKKVFFNGYKEVVTTKLLNGNSLTLTDTHSIITKDGEVMFKDLTSSDFVYYEVSGCRFIETENQRLPFMMAKSIAGIQKAREDLIGFILKGRKKEEINTSMWLSMKKKLALYLLVAIFIIKMATLSTMISVTWLALQALSIFQVILKSIIKPTTALLRKILTTLGRLQKSGTLQKKEQNGTPTTVASVGRRESLFPSPARIAERIIRQSIWETQDFARTNVNLLGVENQVLMTLEEFASVAGNYSWLTSTQSNNFAPVVAVYDLEIEDEHEYFANGLLVHNCVDAIRYAAEGLKTSGEMSVSAVSFINAGI